MDTRILKMRLLPLIGLLAWLALPLAARLIQPEEAVAAASAWMAAPPAGNAVSQAAAAVYGYRSGNLEAVTRTRTLDAQTSPDIYLVKYPQGQFAVVSANDNSLPVLAYSADVQNYASYPPAFYYWLDIYAGQAAWIRDKGLENPQNQELWQDLSSRAQTLENNDTRSVSPLLSVMWNQDWPYNELCPADAAGPGGHVYAGCVATAMGMVMKYWNHPPTGLGSNSYYAYGYGYQSANFGATTYQWDLMPESVGASNLPVATLLYHCGVAVEMDYSPDGSGASSFDVPNAMNNNFRYQNAVLAEKDNYAQAAWINLLKAQVDNGVPLYYSGHDMETGHAFVLDGYDANDYFHFNFGWSGSSNGYFSISDVGGFSYGQAALINCLPLNYSITGTRIKMRSSAAVVGNPLTLTLSTNPVLGSWDVDHFQFQVLYDHTNMEFSGASLAGTIASAGTVTCTAGEPGVLQVSWDGPNALRGGGDLIQLSFLPLDLGDFLFDIGSFQYNGTPVNNVPYLVISPTAPVATLAESQIRLSNVMHLDYGDTGITSMTTTYLIPSWNVNHYEFDLVWDPAKLAYSGLAAAETLSEGSEPVATQTSTGSLHVSCDNSAGNWSGDGVLLRFSFQAVGSQSSTAVTQVSAQNFLFNDVAVTSLTPANFILMGHTAVEDDLMPAAPKLTVFPNPSSGQASLRFAGKSGQPVYLQIFNLKGQVARRILLQSPSAEYVWDTRNDNGALLPSGIYMISWQQGSQTGSSKLLIVR